MASKSRRTETVLSTTVLVRNEYAAAPRSATPNPASRTTLARVSRGYVNALQRLLVALAGMWLRASFVALLVLSTGSCGTGPDTGDYQLFVASHDAIRPGMPVRQAFEAGLADYLIKLGGKNIAGSTVPHKQPVNAECRRHVFDVHYGRGDLRTPGGFTVRVYCNMNGPAYRQVTPQGSYRTKADFLDGLETYSPWAKSMNFRVESPPLKIGGVYDHYNFSTDESGKIATVSSINKSSN